MSLLKEIVVDNCQVLRRDLGAAGRHCVLAQSEALAGIWYALLEQNMPLFSHQATTACLLGDTFKSDGGGIGVL